MNIFPSIIVEKKFLLEYQEPVRKDCMDQPHKERKEHLECRHV